LLAAGAAVVWVFTGCESIPPGAEPGPHGTMAYDLLVEASPPGARVEVNGEDMGPTPAHLKVFGDPDGTFHDFGSYYYVLRGLPLETNQFVQARVFRTGRYCTPEDMIPKRIYFDMNQPPPAPSAGEGGTSTVYGPSVYYGPPPYYYYPPPYWYGPRFHFYFGPGYYWRHW